MDTKIQVFKTKRTERTGFIKKIAQVCECSTKHVRDVLDDRRNGDTELGEKIWLAATLLEEKENLLIQELKRIVNI